MGQPSESAGLPPGVPRWFGKYEVLRHLAAGGMAELYLARTTGIEGFEKTVVVKRMLPIIASDPDCVRLFLNEARLAAQLQHANIVQVHDVGSEDGNYFIAMEFVQGVDVRAIAARARERQMPVPHAVALAIASDVCAGLHYAHERKDVSGKPLNLVHCDVSPSNVMVAFDGVAKVADFGIAKAGGGSGTRQSALRGKFGYMSPEQCLGESLDRRSDVYAIALLVAELTCGARFFVGASDYEIMKQVVERPPPRPSALSPGYPADLEAIILRGLARDRDARWQSAQALQVALEEYGREHKLAMSSVTVAEYLSRLFAEELGDVRADDLGEVTVSLISQRQPNELPQREPTAVTIAEAVVTAAPRKRSVARRLVLGGAALALAVAAGFAIQRSSKHDTTATSSRPAKHATGTPAAAGATPTTGVTPTTPTTSTTATTATTPTTATPPTQTTAATPTPAATPTTAAATAPPTTARASPTNVSASPTTVRSTPTTAGGPTTASVPSTTVATPTIAGSTPTTVAAPTATRPRGKPTSRSTRRELRRTPRAEPTGSAQAKPSPSAPARPAWDPEAAAPP